jgi:hypothetical protein
MTGRHRQQGWLPQLDWGHRVEIGWLAGRHRWQASSHRIGVHLVGIGWMTGRHRQQGWLLQLDWGHRVEIGWLAGRHRWQAELA